MKIKVERTIDVPEGEYCDSLNTKRCDYFDLEHGICNTYDKPVIIILNERGDYDRILKCPECFTSEVVE